MSATDEQILKLFTDIKEVCIDVIQDAHIFIETHELKGDLFFGDKYPGLWTDIFYDDKYYEEVREKIPVLNKANNKDTDNNGFPWAVVVIATIAVVGIATTFTIIKIKKK